MITAEELSALTVGQIRKLALPEDSDMEAFLELLEQDSRRGVRDQAAAVRRKLVAEAREQDRLADMKAFENELRNQGFERICGIDEVGRGPLAGPVVTCAAVLPAQSNIPGIDDSKKLSHKKRAMLAKLLKNETDYAFGVMSPEHIDEMNILNATKHAMVSAAGRLDPRPDLLLVDAVSLKTEIPVRAVIHGDALCYSIAAASILAKEYRDDYMRKMAVKYPQYGFDRNMGYGTEEHIEAIRTYGLTPIHRKTFCTKFVTPEWDPCE